MTFARLSAWFLLVLVALSACAGGPDSAIEKHKTITPIAPPSATASSTATIPATATLPAATPLPLQSYSSNRYTVHHPQGWLPSAAVGSDDVLIAPPGEANYGLNVRWLGSGYSPDTLDALLNGEIEALRSSGLLPQEVGLRQAVTPAAGGTGRSAQVEAVIGETPAEVWITAFVSNGGDAYLLRFWYPAANAEDALYPAMQAQIVSGFVPLESLAQISTVTPTLSLTPTLLPSATPSVVPPSDTPTTPPTVTWTASAAPTVEVAASATSTLSPEPTQPAETATLTPLPLPLEPSPYESNSFAVNYPVSWTPTLNLDGSVTFLPSNPGLLAGITVRLVGTSFDLDVAPANLLETYLAEVAAESPDAVISDQRAEEISPFARGVSTTYVVPYAQGRLVYRVTLLVSVFTDGSAYRIEQWADESLYSGTLRELYRGVVMTFRPLAAEAPATSTPQGS